MLKLRSIAIACFGASLLGLASQASAQGWGGMTPPWGGPSAASRSTVPSNAAGPFNAYYAAYGSYPDPIESRYSAIPQGAMANNSTYGRLSHTAGRMMTEYPGNTVYYGGVSVLQPQAAPAETVPLQVVPMPSAPAPMMPAMPNPCCPQAPCAPPAPCTTNNPCCPPCPASWQHRCGQRMGDMLSRMKECCDNFCAKLANCCQPKPQPCCWTGYQAWWHAPQPSNCMMNECLTQGGASAAGEPLGMEIATPGAEVIDGAISESYESVDPMSEVVEEGPSLIEYGRPTYDDAPVTIPSTPAPPTSPVPTTTPESSISTPAKAAGHVENDFSVPVDGSNSDSSDAEAPELPTPELVLPPQDDATT